jgi:hypothetical protein
VLAQSEQEVGKVEPPFEVLARGQQLAVDRHGVGRPRSGGERVGAFQQPLGRGRRPRRRRRRRRRLGHRLGRRHAAGRLVWGWGHGADEC